MEMNRVEYSKHVVPSLEKESIAVLWKRARRNRKRDEQLLAEYHELVRMWKGMILVIMSLRQKSFPAAVMTLYEEVKATEAPAGDKMIQTKAVFLAALHLEDSGEHVA